MKRQRWIRREVVPLVLACAALSVVVLGVGGATPRADAAPGDVWQFDKGKIRTELSPHGKSWQRWFLVHPEPEEAGATRQHAYAFVSKDGDEKRILSMGALALDLTRTGKAMVSADGTTAVEYGGDPQTGEPTSFRLRWMLRGGRPPGPKEKRAVSSSFPMASIFSMSSDGVIAVARPQRAGGTRLHVYDQEGAPLVPEPVIDPALAVGDLRVLSKGRGVLVRTAQRDRPLAEHQLFLWRYAGPGGGKLEDIPLVWGGRKIEIVQRYVPLGDSPFVFVQGLAHVGLVDVQARKPVWIHKKRLRLASPDGAALGPKGSDALLLLSLENKDRVTGRYTMRLHALDLRSGAQLGKGEDQGSVVAPDPRHGTWSRVFERIEPTVDPTGTVPGDSITIVTDEVRITFPYTIRK